eukprot:9870562-Ditylum_brightwellii.AAC.1
MGKSFKIVEESGRFVNITGSTNDLLKNNVPIRSAPHSLVEAMESGAHAWATVPGLNPGQSAHFSGRKK